MNKPPPGQFKSFNNYEVWPQSLAIALATRSEFIASRRAIENDTKIFKFLRVLNTELVNKTRGIPHV